MPEIEEKAIKTIILKTQEYAKFKNLKGNRKVDPKHVNRLINSMENNGNLTQVFPVIVNDQFEIIDGQHRLEACKQLGFPVFYEVKEGLTINTVISLNTNSKNWTPMDYCQSFAQQGLDPYIRFLNITRYFPQIPFSVVLYVLTNGNNTSVFTLFKQGELVLSAEDQKRGFDMLKHVQECCEAIGRFDTFFSKSIILLIKSPAYDHKRMITKLQNYGDTIPRYHSQPEYQRAIEEVYNYRQPDNTRVRLF